MTSKLTIAKVGGGVIDLTSFANRKGAPYFDVNTSLIEQGMRFANGEAAQSTFKVMDPDAEIARADFAYNLPAHKLVTWSEDAPGAEVWLFRGRAGQYEGGRGVVLADNEVEYDVTADDINRDLRFQAFTAAWVRPAETDVARLMALDAYTLSGASSTATDHGDDFEITISTTHLAPNTNTVTMPAKTYEVGTQPQDVIQDCADAAGKVYGVVIHHTGGSHACLLYILETDHATYASPIKISDNLADWDPEDLSAPVFEPHWEAGKASLFDGQQLLSGLVSIGQFGSVFVEIPGNVTSYGYAVETYYDSTSTTVAQATAVAEGILNKRAYTHVTHRVSVIMLPAQVDLVTAGMSLQIKAAAAIAGQYLDIYQTRRVAQLKFEPRTDGRYWAHMELDRAMVRKGQSPGKSQPKSTVPTTPPICLPDIPGSPIVTWNFEDNDDLDTTNTYNIGLIIEQAASGNCPTGGGNYCGYNTASSGGGADEFPVTAGNDYVLTLLVRWKYDPVPRDISIRWFNSSHALISTQQVIAGDGHSTGVTYSESATATAPTGATGAKLFFTSLSGVFVDNVVFSSAGTEADNPPNCIPAPTGEDTGHYPPADDVRFTADDQHLITKIRQRVINNSGVTLSAGDVVIADTTIDGPAVTRTTTANSTAGPIGVIETGGIDDAEVVVLWSGAIPFVNTNGTPADGDYLFTSTTAGAADRSATRGVGAFGRIVRDDGAGETLHCLIWGVPDGNSGGTLTVQEDDVTVEAAATTLDFGTALSVTSAPAGEANISVDLGTSATQAAAGNHTHVAGDSSQASASGDITTTASLADVTGASLSLVAGTYIIKGTFDVEVNSALNDRVFEGHLDVGGSDQNDIALLKAPGLVDVRATVGQTWRITLGSTTTVKLRAQHSGGTTGDFDVKGANSTIAAWIPAGGAATFVGCKVAHIADQSINNNSTTTVTFGAGTEQWDTDAFHDTSTNPGRITIPSGKDGKYTLYAQGDWTANGTGVRRIVIAKNGANLVTPLGVSYQGAPNSVSTFQAVSGEADMVATDYIELQVLQVSGAALNGRFTLGLHRIG